jgi:ribonuclease BN (tRNA processing enzyme)
MKLRVLGSAGAEFPNFRPPAFLIDDHLLLDAGTIGAVLTEEEQANLQHLFITHSHLDHIRGIPALADNIIIKNLQHTVSVYSIPDVVSAMQNHLFNNVIWPDFTAIPDTDNPVISFKTLDIDREYSVTGYSIRAIPVNHTVPAVGYRVCQGGTTLLYSGDTGPTDEIWKYANDIDVLIVEVSFPNSMESLALLTKHLTCSLLRTELDKITTLPKRIFVTHPKPQYVDIISSEIEALGLKGIELLHDGAVFEI